MVIIIRIPPSGGNGSRLVSTSCTFGFVVVLISIVSCDSHYYPDFTLVVYRSMLIIALEMFRRYMLLVVPLLLLNLYASLLQLCLLVILYLIRGPWSSSSSQAAPSSSPSHSLK